VPFAGRMNLLYAMFQRESWRWMKWPKAVASKWTAVARGSKAICQAFSQGSVLGRLISLVRWWRERSSLLSKPKHGVPFVAPDQRNTAAMNPLYQFKERCCRQLSPQQERYVHTTIGLQNRIGECRSGVNRSNRSATQGKIDSKLMLLGLAHDSFCMGNSGRGGLL
jgi:hypothetical protein